MAYKSIWKKRGFVCKFSGEVTLDEVMNVHKEFFSDPRSDNASYLIFDTLDIKKSFLTEEDAKFFAAFDSAGSKSVRNARVAIIANSGEILAHSQNYASKLRDFSSSWFVRVFTDSKEAEEWCLGGN